MFLHNIETYNIFAIFLDIVLFGIIEAAAWRSNKWIIYYLIDILFEYLIPGIDFLFEFGNRFTKMIKNDLFTNN